MRVCADQLVCRVCGDRFTDISDLLGVAYGILVLVSNAAFPGKDTRILDSASFPDFLTYEGSHLTI